MNEVAGRRFEQLIAWRLGVRVTKYMLIILKPSQRIIREQLIEGYFMFFFQMDGYTIVQTLELLTGQNW